VKLEISLPDEVVAQIDAIAVDRSAFVASSVTRMLEEIGRRSTVSDSPEDDVQLASNS